MKIRNLILLILAYLAVDCTSSDSAQSLNPGIPAPPGHFSAECRGDNAVYLNWNDSSAIEKGYLLYYGLSENERDDHLVLPADSTNFVLTGLIPGSNYWFFLEAFNDNGVTESVSTWLKVGTPLPPTDLNFTYDTNNGDLQVGWQDNANNEDSYYLYYSTNNDAPIQPSVILAADTVSHTISGLTTNCLYYFWLASSRSYGTSIPLFRSRLISGVYWSDEFEGLELKEYNWNIVHAGTGFGNNELQYYTPRETNLYLSNGELHIRALKEDYGGLAYTSAKIYSQHKIDVCYGRIEARMKLPWSQGMWPAFWMMPTYSIYGGWPNSGEIDIMELVGYNDNRVYGTVHREAGSGINGDGGSTMRTDFQTSWHIFCIDWTPDAITWYCDGSQYHQYLRSGSTDSNWWPFDQDFYLIFNLAVGGNWPGSPDGTTVFPMELIIDWVRIYK